MTRPHSRAGASDAAPPGSVRVSLVLMLATLATYVVVGLISLYFRDWKTIWAVTGGSVALLAPLLLFRSGRHRSGTIVLMIIVIASVTAIATVGQGIRDLSMVALPIVLIYAGLTSERFMLRLCGGLIFIGLLWLAFGEPLRFFATVPLFPDPLNFFYFSVMTVLLIVTILAVDLLSSSMRNSLAQARAEIDERRKAEKLLRQSHLLLTQMGKMAHVGAWVLDRTSLEMEWTEEMFRIHELDHSFTPTIEGGLEFFDPFSRPIMARAIQRLRDAGESFDLELGIVTRNGNARRVRAIGQVDRELRKGYGTLQDVTDQKRSEQEVRDSNELFSQFLLHSPVYAYIKDVTPGKSVVVQASENFKEMVGVPGHEMVGKAMEELFPADFAAKMTADDWAVISGRKPIELDEELSGRFYTTIKFPISRRGKTFLAGYTIDVTERRRSEEARLQSEARFRTLIEHAPVGISISINGIRLYANQKLLKTFGMDSLEEPINRRIADFLAPQSREESRIRTSRRSLGLPVPSEFESVGQRKDGTLFPIQVAVAEVQLSEGLANIAFVTDLTERKRAEAENAKLQ